MSSYKKEDMRGFVTAVQMMGKDLTCVICLSYFKDPSMTKCRHAFCKECINTHLATSDKCPLCKSQCNRRSVREDDKLKRIIDIFKKIHPKSDETKIPEVEYEMSQVDSMSQLARGFGCSASQLWPTPRHSSLNDSIQYDSERTPNITTPIVSQATPATVSVPSTVVVPSTTRVTRDETPPNATSQESLVEESRATHRAMDIEPRRLSFESITLNQGSTVVVPTTSQMVSVVSPRVSQESFKNVSPNQVQSVDNKSVIEISDTPPDRPPSNANNVQVDPSPQAKTPNTPNESMQEVEEKADDDDDEVDDKSKAVDKLESPSQNVFKIGTTVTVSRCMKPNVCRPGGVGRITNVYDNNTYDVKYILDRRHEYRIAACELTLGQDIESSAIFGSGHGTKRTSSTDENLPPPPSKALKIQDNRPRILFTGKFKCSRAKMVRIVEALGGSVVTDPASATHVVVESFSPGNGESGLIAKHRTWNLLSGIVRGLWIVSSKWLCTCSRHQSWIPEMRFQIKGDAKMYSSGTGGASRARQALDESRRNKGMTDGLILHDCKVYFLGTFKNSSLRLEQLQELVVLGGGTVMLDLRQLEESMKTDAKIFVVAPDMKVAKRNKHFEAMKKMALESKGGVHIVGMEWLLNSVSLYQKLDVSKFDLVKNSSMVKNHPVT